MRPAPCMIVLGEFCSYRFLSKQRYTNKKTKPAPPFHSEFRPNFSNERKTHIISREDHSHKESVILFWHLFQCFLNASTLAYHPLFFFKIIIIMICYFCRNICCRFPVLFGGHHLSPSPSAGDPDTWIVEFLLALSTTQVLLSYPLCVCVCVCACVSVRNGACMYEINVNIDVINRSFLWDVCFTVLLFPWLIR